MLADIVDDLRQLENGVTMYNVSCNADVLVVAPLNFIIADNARHSELACHKGAKANFPCRKCFYPMNPAEEDANIDHHNNSTLHSQDDIHALTTNGGSKNLIRMSHDRHTNDLNDLGLKLTGGEVLLGLRVFDQTKDLPIEILHCMMLAITKYIVYSFIKYLRAAETNQLQTKLHTYESNAFGRSMGSCLWLSSTFFVGRDFKFMSQQLPTIINGLLRREWSTLANDRKKVIEIWYNCFVAHGELVSLVYMGQISDDFGEYCRIVHQKVDELTAAIIELEAVCATYHIAGSRVVSKTSKLHILHHLRDDLVRFAPAIHFESEKGEQFNKFIRERIFHTNRHNSSRDVLTLFGRQFIF
ncbi:hypothetical protein BJV82DRAFT_706052 [Fennellomyces sp. T-0311]|nr:hypothetical protein BJV82DRAFT_706052 [Fennellomyces sp. T-0311]